MHESHLSLTVSMNLFSTGFSQLVVQSLLIQGMAFSGDLENVFIWLSRQWGKST